MPANTDPFAAVEIARRPPRPGMVRLRPIAANPDGGVEALLALEADFFAGASDGIWATSRAELPPPRRPGAAHRLRLFHFNDLHNHLAGLTAGAEAVPRPIFARMAAQVAQARADAGPDEAVLFLSAGDDHTGTVFDELLGWSDADFQVDPAYRAYNAAGIDAATLGNHEFDRGSAQLARAIPEAAFPLLSANLHGSIHLRAGRDYHAALLARIKGLNIGIIGLTTQVETRTGRPEDPAMALASPAKTLTRVLGPLGRLADMVVVLSHCGYGGGLHTSGKAEVPRDIGEADFDLADIAARLCPCPIVIIGAHTHTRLHETGTDTAQIRGGVLIAQAECNGRYLGEVQLSRDRARQVQARLHPIAASELSSVATNGNRDDALAAATEAFHCAHIRPLVARIESTMGEIIAQAEGAELAWHDVARARYGDECALANFMNDTLVTTLATQDSTAADLALLNGASILSGLPPGPVRFGQWFDVMPYADEIYLLEASGAEIAAILQSNARRILRPEENGIDPTGFVPRGFLHASAGLRYRIRLGAGAEHARACDITLFGRPIAQCDTRRYRIATTTYLALGSFGERWNGAPLAGGILGALTGFDLRSIEAHNTGLIYRDQLTAQIRRQGRIRGRRDGRLQLAP